jgi:hypothetical protein
LAWHGGGVTEPLPKQHLAVRLLEGVHSSPEALTLRRPTMISGIECHVLLPRPTSRGYTGVPLRPPVDAHQKTDPDWAAGTGWPKVTWGDGHSHHSVTITAVGLIPFSEPIQHRRIVDFDRAAGQHLLGDWLSVFAGGPTDTLSLPGRGGTEWVETKNDAALWVHYTLSRRRPWPVSRWQWEHALAHIHSGDQPPLALVLLASAKRAAADGNPRLAVIDAATAAEVALTHGLTDHLSAQATSQVAQVLTDRARMLGPRLQLARDLGMPLPDRIHPDLVDRRNAAVHRGTTVTETDAQAAITKAAELVSQYEPLPDHCHDPSNRPQERCDHGRSCATPVVQ